MAELATTCSLRFTGGDWGLIVMIGWVVSLAFGSR
jgi:hypothetical protein